MTPRPESSGAGCKLQEVTCRLERLVLHELAAGRELHEVLSSLVCSIEQEGRDLVGSVLLMDESGRRLLLGAAPHLPPAYNQAVNGVSVGPRSGSCGTAAYFNRPVVVEDTATDPLWADYRNLAAEHGLKACWSLPVNDENGGVLGTFAFYHHTPRPPTGYEMQLAETATRVARLAISHGREQAQLRLLDSVVARLSDMVLITTAGEAPSWSPRVVFANEAFTRGTGYSTPEVAGTGPEIICASPGDAARLSNLCAELRSGVPGRMDLLLHSRTGGECWVELSASPVNGSDGRVTHFVLLMRDITERRAAEDSMSERDRVMSVLMTHLPGMAYYCRNDANWTMDYVSEGCRMLTGYDPADLIGNHRISYEQLIMPEDRAMVRTAVHEALVDRRPYEMTYRIRAADGSVRWVWERGSGYFTSAGALQHLEGFINDITERKMVEDQLAQAQRLESIGTLAGGIAHDLNNILSPILMAASLLEQRLKQPELDLARKIMSSTQRAAVLVKQILTFARGGTRDRQLLQPAKLVETLVGLIGETMHKSIRLETAVDPGVDAVKGRASQIVQVLLNLCVNARDAMPNGGVLRVVVSNRVIEASQSMPHPDARPGRYVCFRVEDTGGGIQPEVVHRIFDPFFTTKGPGVGTGLGLSITRAIVQDHGGFIVVDSMPGSGTHFSILLPSAAGAAEESAASKPPAAERPFSGENILVVDDESMVRDTTRILLETWGLGVVTVSNGAEAIAAFTERPDQFSAVVMDVDMPVLDGLAAARALRAMVPDVPIIAVSGFMQPYMRDGLEQTGGCRMLEKPLNPAGLRRMLESLMARNAVTEGTKRTG